MRVSAEGIGDISGSVKGFKGEKRGEFVIVLVYCFVPLFAYYNSP